MPPPRTRNDMHVHHYSWIRVIHPGGATEAAGVVKVVDKDTMCWLGVIGNTLEISVDNLLIMRKSQHYYYYTYIVRLAIRYTWFYILLVLL